MEKVEANTIDTQRVKRVSANTWLINAAFVLIIINAALSIAVDHRQDAADNDLTAIAQRQLTRIQILEARITTLDAQIDIVRAEANARDGL